MKNYLFLILFFSLGIVQNAKAQSCDEMLKAAKAEEAKGEYFRAYQKYEAALNNCGEGRKDEIKKLKDNAILALQNLKNEAIRQKENALKAEKKAIDAQKEIQTALAETEKQKQIADQNLAKANKLINAFYFYDDKLALTTKYNKFYFIDKNGDKVEKLGEWDKAEHFEGNTFAKVKKDSKDYLLDTLGNTYSVAYSLKDLTSEIKALDLTGMKLDNFPMEILAERQLEILILDAGYGENDNIKILPPQISELKNLKFLHLTGFQLESLPAQIGELKNLTWLNLGNNKLTAFPLQFGELKNLIWLNLGGNELTTLPSQLFKLKSLKKLYLHHNKITTLPIQISELINLLELDLSLNQLTNLPSQIGELANLTDLALSRNKLKALPTKIGELTNLTDLTLSENDSLELSSVFIAFRSFKKKIKIQTYQFNGNNNKQTLLIKIPQYRALPNEIGELENLTELDLSRNKITTLPSQMGKLKNLIVINLNENELEALPLQIEGLKNLRLLNLSRNKLTTLPNEIGKLKNLTNLDLSSNKIAILPTEIGELENLTELNLGGNQLEILPNEIGRLKNLKELNLQFNRLTTLPIGIEGLKNLIQLDLIYNQLAILPAEIGELKNLKLLRLGENKLTLLPTQIGELKNLIELDLGTFSFISKNQIRELPLQIGELRNLESLSLTGNLLNTLPAQFWYLKNLKYLNLVSNQFTTLPAQIGELENLINLDLGNNQLTNLPHEIGELKNLNDLHLNNNQFTTLPTQIGELKNLINLDLGNNQLTNLPHEIGELKNLKTLNLIGNDSLSLSNICKVFSSFHRSIKLSTHIGYESPSPRDMLLISIAKQKKLPTQIGQLKNLTDLYLSDNQLTILPTQIGELKNLINLDLGNNQLTNLPHEIGELKNLGFLILTNNLISEEEQEKIRKLLPPNCTIWFPTIDYFEIGQKAFDEKNYPKALHNYLKTIEKDNTNGPAYGNAGLCHRLLGNLDSALIYLDKYLKLKPNESWTIKQLSYTYRDIASRFFRERNYKEALSNYVKVIQKDSTNEEAYLNAGLCNRFLGNLDSALIYLDKYLKLKPNDLWVIKQLVSICSEIKEYKRAYYFTQKTAELEANNYSNWFNLSFYTLFVGKPQEAIQAAQKTLELNPKAAGVETNLALGYLLNNQWTEAEKIYLKWKGKTFPDDKRLCDEIFLSDIADLEKAGVTHPDFEKVRKLFGK